MKILIVRLSALGDVLHCLPSLHALRDRFPDATIGWVVEELSAELLRADRRIDELIVLPRKSWQSRLKKLDAAVLGEAAAFFKALRSKRYDVAIDFQGNFRSGMVTALCGARTRIGFSQKYSRELNVLFTNRRLAPNGTARHKVDRNLVLLRALGIADPSPEVELPVNETAAADVARFLRQLPKANKLIVLHPGTSRFGGFKRWPEEKYEALGQSLARQVNAAILVTWGPGEEELATRIAEGIGKGARACFATSLPQLAELIRAADLLISGDTGPMNIAPLVGTPSVTLFGPKDPAVYAPRSEASRVVVKEIPCRPCGLRACPVVWCMKWITPAEVFAPALELLSSAGADFHSSGKSASSSP